MKSDLNKAFYSTFNSIIDQVLKNWIMTTKEAKELISITNRKVFDRITSDRINLNKIFDWFQRKIPMNYTKNIVFSSYIFQIEYLYDY